MGVGRFGRRAAIALSLLCAVVLVGSVAMMSGSSDGVADREVVGFSPSAQPDGVAPGTLDDAPSAPAASGVVASGVPVPRVPIPSNPPAVSKAQTVSDVPVRSGEFTSIQGAPPVPVVISIPDIALEAPVEPVGYDVATGEMQVPRSADAVGWYRYGPSPGEPGSAVLAAHVDWNGKPGPFFRLFQAGEGARIVISYTDGSQREFRATSLAEYPKDALPADELFATAGPVTVTLITCGGDFDRAARSYEGNVVLRAAETP